MDPEAKRHHRQRGASLCLVLLVGATSSHAEADAERTTLSGFGTLGYVRSTLADTGFIRDLSQFSKPGRRESFKVDSRIGLQINHTLDSELELVGQLLLSDQYEHDLDSRVTRAFAGYRPAPDWLLRAGRLGDTTYLMSDYRDVGYAYPWVRPPETAYTLLAVQHYDGVDLSYRIDAGEVGWRLRALAGRTDVTIPLSAGGTYRLATDDLAGFALVREEGPLHTWLGHSTFSLAHDYMLPAAVRDGLRALAGANLTGVDGEAADLLDMFDLAGTRIGYSALGFRYDGADWFAQGEIGHLAAPRKAFAQGTQAYLGIGYRAGNLMPFALLGSIRPARPALVPRSDWGDQAPLQSVLIGLANGVRADQDLFTLGLRWDFASQAAVKFQWSRMWMHADGWSLWFSDPALRTRGRHGDVYSLTLDYVF